MDYRILLQEENDAVRERYELSMERIRSMDTEEMQLPYGCYFKKVSAFIRRIERLAKRVEETGLSREAGLDGALLTLEELREENHALYQDILPENYGESFANPDYAVEVLGDGYGQLLSFLYTEIRADIVYAFEMRLMNITILNELFLEVYNLFVQAWEEGRKAPQEQLIKDSLYWFVSDYAEVTVDWRIREGLDPALSFGTDIVMEQDLTDLRYLYAYGEYVSETEIKLASFMNSLPQETIDQMASTYTEGFRKGFQVMGRDLKKKRTVVVEFQLGFERMIRRAVEYFREMGLEPICYRAAVESVNRRANGRRGYYGTSPNKQYDYDHRYDSALYMGNAFKERKLAVLRSAYETRRKEAAWCAGPALVETFGEEGFTPVNKKTALALNAHQEALTLAYANESRRIVNQYMPGDETSFTIIAFPKPEIGPEFEEVFRETIRINTLDYEKYQKIQQRIIRALDEASHVLITGRGGNETSMKVSLHPLKDREKETNFENCVSDVNIPLGEVFTSPILKGTEGLLHVKNVYVEDYQFRNLRMVFKDGKVTEYSCGNFEEDGSTREAGNGEAAGAAGSVGNPGNGETAGTAGEARRQGQALVKQVIMRNHDWLPLGEFAIGTNTTAYAMARRFSIGDKLPILIAEKMGPHFAVGDTCYSFAEDSPMYNPDGREVIARDNEISLLRKTDMSKAYFSCHTDITIPYSELGDIKAVRADGSGIDIIRQGRFVLDGTEELNEALDEASD
ncbi:aminopeptidase [Enterocloster clostridioformis]|uniref:aminopeptidase n=1 Tax=Enterocloster clostridioformis TaxID=1531 RepID=UPI0026746E8B|nr:aminopeptidase [Enterocloster clostridioformis]